jgi:hypothetical protein
VFSAGLCFGGTISALERPAQGVKAFPSQEEMFDWYQRTTLDAVSRFRRQMSPVLTSAQRAQEQEIAYEVVRSDDPSVAEAAESKGKRVIRISVGFMRLLETMVEASAVSYVQNKPDLALRYYRYFAETINESVVRLQRGQTATPIQLFPQWIGWTEAERKRNWNDARLGTQRSQGVYAALAFVVSHETAHHLLGHRSYSEKSDAEARADETAADSFAADILVKLELPPAAALPLIGFWSVLGNNPIEREAASTHPSDERRLFALLDRSIAAVANDPDFQRYLRENNLVERWKAAEEANRTGAKEIARITSTATTGRKQSIPRGAIKFAR